MCLFTYYLFYFIIIINVSHNLRYLILCLQAPLDHTSDKSLLDANFEPGKKNFLHLTDKDGEQPQILLVNSLERPVVIIFVHCHLLLGKQFSKGRRRDVFCNLCIINYFSVFCWLVIGIYVNMVTLGVHSTLFVYIVSCHTENHHQNRDGDGSRISYCVSVAFCLVKHLLGWCKSSAVQPRFSGILVGEQTPRIIYSAVFAPTPHPPTPIFLE